MSLPAAVHGLLIV